jgi:hypothetical protein
MNTGFASLAAATMGFSPVRVRRYATRRGIARTQAAEKGYQNLTR